jgi:hypothetical protein
MKSKNSNKEQLRLISRFLYGLMNEKEENSFFEKIKIDEKLRALAVSDVVLCKNYSMEEIHNKELVEELRKTEAGSLLLCPEWDSNTETDN